MIQRTRQSAMIQGARLALRSSSSPGFTTPPKSPPAAFWLLSPSSMDPPRYNLVSNHPSPSEYNPSAAELVILGGVGNLQHGPLCTNPKVTLMVCGERVRVQCSSCQHFAQLPTREDYQEAWKEIGDRPQLQKVQLITPEDGGPMLPPRLDIQPRG